MEMDLSLSSSRTSSCSSIWGTWEDLILCSAVDRHGKSEWEMVGFELQSRAIERRLPYSSSFTALACQSRYKAIGKDFLGRIGCQDLNQEELEKDTISLALEDLRSKRIAQLKMDLQQSEDSIMELQNKLQQLQANPIKVDEALDITCKLKRIKLNHNSTIDPNDPNSCYIVENSTKLQLESMENKFKLLQNTDVDEDGHSQRESTTNSTFSTSKGGEGDMYEITYKRRSKRRHGKNGLQILQCWRKISNHNYAPFFKQRQPFQEQPSYFKLIRNHIDLSIIRQNIDDGVYISNAHFFRDLLMMINNALVYFHRKDKEFRYAMGLLESTKREMKSIFDKEH